MIVSFRLSNASLMIVLALGITTSACGGGYSNPSGGGQSKPLRSVTCLCAVSAIHSSEVEKLS